MLMSCGVADLIATCAGGRNRLCSAAYAKRIVALSDSDFFGNNNNNNNSGANNNGANKAGLANNSGVQQKSNNAITIRQSVPSGQPLPKDPWQSIPDAAGELWTEIEADLLHGQKLQGVDTCFEVVECLKSTPAEIFEPYLKQLQIQQNGSSDSISNGVDNASTANATTTDGKSFGSKLLSLIRVEKSVASPMSPQEQLFPLIHRVHGIACMGADINTLLDWPRKP